MIVKMDSGKIAEVSLEQTRHINYGYAVDTLKNVRAERVIVTGDGLTQQGFQPASSKADLALYNSSPQQEFATPKEVAAPEIAQRSKQQHDFGIGF
jgi:hypothetical protein